MYKSKRIISSIAINLISLYQKTASPDHSWIRGRFTYGFCRFYPSCSEYTKQAIEKFGVVKGLYLGIKRVARCHPWSESKVDLVPNL